MAKQDLVVKLMLNSGAFGNDIREAERKAKQFSDNMKSSGKSVGEFTKEIGLNTGALGKLGGAITGVGGVVMAVGAFKSVMESSYPTAKTFQSNIEGCKGVIDAFQRALTDFDFSNFTNGTKEIFDRAKEAKETLMDYQRSKLLYGSLITEDLSILKKYESEFKNPTTTEGRRNEIRKELDLLLESMNENLEKYKIKIQNAFVSGIESFDVKIKDLNYEDAVKYFKDARLDMMVKDKEEIKRILDAYKEIADKVSEKEKEISKIETRISTSKYRLDNPDPYDLITPKKAAEMRANIAIWEKQLAGLERERDKLLYDNQELFFKKVAYSMADEELSNIINLINEYSEATTRYNEIKLTSGEWSKQTQAQTKTATKEIKEQVEAEKTYKQTLKDKIKELENEINLLDEGTTKWREKTIELQRYISKLAEVIAYGKELEAQYSHRFTSVNSPTPMTTDEIMKNALDTGLSNWRNNQPKFTFETEEFDDLNIAISSSINMLNALSSAFSLVGDESSATLQTITNTMGSLASGIMGFIQIQQAASAAAGTASAAALPFPYNLAAIATVMSTILSVFANIRSMTAGKFADGGIVGGTSYSGDKLFAMVNSGEMILNKRQQSNLSNMLGVGGQVEFHISGETLVGVLNNIDRKKHLIR